MRNLTTAVEAVKNSPRFGYYDCAEIHLPLGPGDILPRVLYVSTADIEVAATLDFNDFIYRAFIGVLARPPLTSERSDWSDALLTAWDTGLGNLTTAAADLIDALFALAEYTDRMRNDEQFVRDLYASYLGRLADSAGAATWLAGVIANGRAAAQTAFRVSLEFSDRLSIIVSPTAYANDAREPGDVSFSNGAAIDGLDFALTNADNAYSDLLGQPGRRLTPCPAVWKRAFQLLDGTYEAVVMVDGFARFGDLTAENIKGVITADTTPDGTDVVEEVPQHCVNIYKLDGCDSTDGSPTCSHVRNDAVNGCISKAPAPQLIDIAPPNNLPSFKGIAQPPAQTTTTTPAPGVGLGPGSVGPSGWPTDTYDPHDPIRLMLHYQMLGL